MVEKHTIDHYASSVTHPAKNKNVLGGYFAAVRLDDFSAESLKATTVYNRKDFYKISLITGHASYIYRDKEYLVRPGEAALVFTNREVPYRWEVHSGSCSGYSCLFTEDFMPMHTYLRPSDWTVFNGTGQSVFYLDNKQNEQFATMFRKMIAEQGTEYRHKYELLFLYVLECIHAALKLETETISNNVTAAKRLADAFQTLLAGQFPLITPDQRIENRYPQDFADKLAVHTNHLNRAIKTVTGSTTTKLLTERIMQEASALLVHSNWSIGQISYSLGFDEPTHFTQAFRRYTGHTPSTLRKMV